jgi:antitoxin YefM
LYVEEVVMKVLSYSESRRRYAEVLDSVVDDQEEVVVTRSGREPAVIVSLSAYEALKETDYLLRSPANARRLREAIADLEAGRGAEHEPVE